MQIEGAQPTAQYGTRGQSETDEYNRIWTRVTNMATGDRPNILTSDEPHNKLTKAARISKWKPSEQYKKQIPFHTTTVAVHPKLPSSSMPVNQSGKRSTAITNHMVFAHPIPATANQIIRTNWSADTSSGTKQGTHGPHRQSQERPQIPKTK